MEITGNFPEETHTPTWVCWAVRASGEHPFTLKQEALFLGESSADQNLRETRNNLQAVRPHQESAGAPERPGRTGGQQRGLGSLRSRRWVTAL